MDGGERNVNRVELVVAGSGRDHPASAGSHAHYLERLFPNRDDLPVRIGFAKQFLRNDASQNDNLVRVRFFPAGIETSSIEFPRPSNKGQRNIVAMQACEPPFIA